MTVNNPWPGPVARSRDAMAVQCDAALREDYNEAQRVARLRARMRGVRQRVQRAYRGEATTKALWRVVDVTALGEPRWVQPARDVGVIHAAWRS